MGLHRDTIKHRYEKALLKIALAYENSKLGKQLDTAQHQLSSTLGLNKNRSISLNSWEICYCRGDLQPAQSKTFGAVFYIKPWEMHHALNGCKKYPSKEKLQANPHSII